MMTLRLSVTSAPPDSPLHGQHLDISVAGASLGRAGSNQCVIPDSERIVSSKHASIRHELGQYVITDHSTNGTFINESPAALGPNNSVPLNEGDCIAMGKYLFTVSLLTQEKPVAAAPAKDSFLDDLGAAPAEPVSEPNSAEADEFDKWLEPQAPAQQQAPMWGAANVVHSPLPSADEENDPLAAIDQARKAESPLGDSFFGDAPAQDDDDWWKTSQKDDVPAINQSFETPKTPQAPVFEEEPTPVPPREPANFAVEATPAPAVEDADDLDALLGLGSGPGDMPAADDFNAVTPGDMSGAGFGDVSLSDVQADAVEPEPFAAEFTEPPPMIAQEPVAAPQQQHVPDPLPVAAATTGHEDTATLLAELLELGNLDQNQLDALTPEVVTVLRQTIAHLLELLRARSSIKNELRLDRTMIQPVENNPLKFALTEKDALRYLFGEHSGAYMSGSRAVKEAFEDISDHQMALLAGMRGAYEKMLSKFSPEALEHRFGEVASKGLLSSKKSRLWDAYVEYFDKLQQDPETSFNRLFGEEFASAYETQVDDIKSSKSDR
jgi:type VI secretion system FHA domain protein